jgi:hypothetical protein
MIGSVEMNGENLHNERPKELVKARLFGWGTVVLMALIIAYNLLTL